MTDGQKEILMLALCLSFFFVCGIFAENAAGIIGMVATPAIPWMMK